MKKAPLFILAVIYMFASTGISVRIHYCGKTVADIMVLPGAGSCCCDEAEEESGCCHDESNYLIIKSEQLANSGNAAIAGFPGFAAITWISSFAMPPSAEPSHLQQPPGGPPPLPAPLFILNHSFIFYG